MIEIFASFYKYITEWYSCEHWVLLSFNLFLNTKFNLCDFHHWGNSYQAAILTPGFWHGIYSMTCNVPLSVMRQLYHGIGLPAALKNHTSFIIDNETKSLDAKGSHRFVIYMNPPPFQKNRALISIKDIEYPEKL